jgi:ribosome-binding protein aMBF1 (putative translation factor)
MPTYRTWKDVRAEALATGRLDEKRVAEETARLLAEIRAHRLAEIRESSGLNQTDLANRLGVSQSRVSRIERGDMDHTEIATVRAYVGALGGEVEIIAKFGDERIMIG